MREAGYQGNRFEHSLRARQFAALDGMRGVAAILVALRHTPYLWAVPSHPEGLMRDSYLAVDLFFMLSGFVLEFVYRPRIQNGISVVEFMKLRLVRLYPLYGLSLLIALVFGTYNFDSVRHFAIVITTSVLFLPCPSRNGEAVLFPMNFPAWSLFFEICVNFMFIVIGRCLTQRVLLAIILLAGFLLATCSIGNFVGFRGDFDAGATWAGFLAASLRVIFGFFLGVGLFRLKSFAPPICILSMPLAMILLTALLVSQPLGYPALFDLICVTLIIPVLVYTLADLERPESAKLLQVLRWLGLVSYGVYALQVPIYSAIVVCFGDSTSLPRTSGIVSALFVVACAHVATRYIDIPIRRLIGKHV